MIESANKITGANSRPASPFQRCGFIAHSRCAPPFVSAAVAQFSR
jgi:hypothetical protein